MKKRVFIVGGALIVLSMAALWLREPRISSDISLYRKAAHSLDLDVDPLMALSTAQIGYLNLVHESLFGPNEYLEIQPRILGEWSLDPSGTQYLLTLKKGLLFSDGTRVRAEDVVRGLRRLSAPSSPVFHRFFRMKGVRALDEGRVLIELAEPYPPFIALLAGPMAKITSERNAGMGPFRLMKVDTRGSHRVATLERNPFFHGTPSSIRVLELWEVNEKEAIRLTAEGVLHDTALLATLNPGLVRDHPHLIERITPAAITWMLTLNVSRPPNKSASLSPQLVEPNRSRSLSKAVSSSPSSSPGLHSSHASGLYRAERSQGVI